MPNSFSALIELQLQLVASVQDRRRGFHMESRDTTTVHFIMHFIGGTHHFSYLPKAGLSLFCTAFNLLIIHCINVNLYS
jgi:hypothetical protein